MNKHDLLDVEKIKAERAAKRDKPGFLQRLQQAAEARQEAINQAKNQGKGTGTGRAGRQMYAKQSKPKGPSKSYKKRK